MFRNEFADDQSEIGDHNYNNEDGDSLGIRTDHWIREQEALKPLGQGGTAERTGDDGGERHSDLHAGQEALRIVCESQRGPRTSLTMFSKLLETAAPRIDHG